MAGYDRRFSSYGREIDAAIERVVTHFEDNDVALRLDVLRGLATHAKLAFESERVKQRLHQHPVAKDLVESVATPSTVFARLHSGLAVEEFSCDYDRKRNVEMRATVRWSLPADEERQSTKKKAAKGKQSSKRRTRDATPLYMQYTFTRTTDEEEGETIVTYAVAAGVGVDGEMKELVRYELASDAPYPRSFYEEDQDMDSDEEEEEEMEQGDEDEQLEEDEDEPSAENGPSDEDDAPSDNDGDEKEKEVEGGEKDEFGEEVRGFDFNDAVMDMILEWLHAEDEELDPADVIGFFLSLPMYEDDWMIDERVCQILFGAGQGGDSEMEEEVVSDFDDEEEEGDDDGEELDVEVADLD